MKTETMRLRSLLLLIAPSVLLVGWGSAYAQSNGDSSADDSNHRFPYQAIVLAEQADVRSGPDAVHYATDRLPQGAVVEVYRHDPGGWCAIRPPRGSFSLIPEGGLEFDDDQVARIAEDGVQAWVGTRLGAVDRPLWQVKLRAGEVVQVLGQVSWPAPEGHSVIWYQIAPPAGEFRWVHLADLQLPDDWTDLPEIAQSQPAMVEPKKRTFGNTDRLNTWQEIDSEIPETLPTVPLVTLNDTAPSPLDLVSDVNPALQDDSVQSAQLDQPLDRQRDAKVQPANLQMSGSINQSTTQSTTQATNQTINQGWRRATRPIRLATAEQPADPLGDGSSMDAGPLSQLPLHSGPADPPFQSQADSRAPGTGRSDGVVQVADVSPTIPDIQRQSPSILQSERGRSMAALSGSTERPLLPPLGSLSERLTQLELMLTQELIRPLGRWRLQPIAEYAQSIQAEPLGPGERVQVERLLMKLADCQRLQQRSAKIESNSPVNTPVGSGVDASVQLGTTYDAYGWLNELVQANGTQPSTYVLQDDQGKIIFHVSPSPGLNLHRYLKQKIGIMGQRGYHKRYRLDHVTAERVVVLQKSR